MKDGHDGLQIDLRSDYERKQDGVGLLVKNARILRVDRQKGVATLKVAHTLIEQWHLETPHLVDLLYKWPRV